MSSAWNVQQLIEALGSAACRFDVTLLPQCESTNAELLTRAENGAPSGTVMVAEEQTAGRGRRGRVWIASAGDSVTFSLLWRLPAGKPPMGLSLAVGVAVVKALENLSGADKNCFTELCLKWPNDILLQGKKLGGVLVELVPGVPHAAVIGIGLNLRLPEALSPDVRATAIAWPTPIDCNQLLAELLRELLAVLTVFSVDGFLGVRSDWLARHAYQDARIVLLTDFAPPRQGVCRGVDEEGALLFDAEGKIERILSGEISLRPAWTP